MAQLYMCFLHLCRTWHSLCQHVRVAWLLQNLVLFLCWKFEWFRLIQKRKRCSLLSRLLAYLEVFFVKYQLASPSLEASLLWCIFFGLQKWLNQVVVLVGKQSLMQCFHFNVIFLIFKRSLGWNSSEKIERNFGTSFFCVRKKTTAVSINLRKNGRKSEFRD